MDPRDQKIAELEERLLRAERRLSSAGALRAIRRDDACFTDAQLTVGMIVATKVNKRFVKARIADRARWEERGYFEYSLEYVVPFTSADGRVFSEIGKRDARDLFPISRLSHQEANGDQK